MNISPWRPEAAARGAKNARGKSGRKVRGPGGSAAFRGSNGRTKEIQRARSLAEGAVALGQAMRKR